MTSRTVQYIAPRYIALVALGAFATLAACEKTTPEAEQVKATTAAATPPPPPTPSQAQTKPPEPPPAPPALPAPDDVGKPPADAKKTASGLATKVLTKG